MAFDTHASVKKLQEAGFTPEQAEAQVEVLKELVEGNLATKRDIELVRHEIELVRRDIELMRRDMKEMETGLRRDMELMRRDIIIWLGGLIVAATTALGVLIKLL